jgi:hypothetical protein
MGDDSDKDLTFKQPAHEEDRYGGGRRWVLDDWTVAGVEEVMWRVRASGGTDSTPVRFEHTYQREEGERPYGTAIKAKHVEAFDFEVPRDRRPAAPDVQRESAPERPSPARRALGDAPVKTAAQWAACAALLPVVGVPLLYLWSWMLDLLGALP